MRARALIAATAVGFVCAAPDAAQAHLVSARFGDFYNGMLHPITALEHGLPMLALGMLAGLQEPKVARWLLLAAPLGLLFGVLLAQLTPALHVLIFANRASFVVLGLLIALNVRLSAQALIGLGAIIGLTHGYENGAVMDAGVKVYLFALGVAAVGLIGWALTAAATVWLVAGPGWRRIAIRAAGSWIAAIGLMVVVV